MIIAYVSIISLGAAKCYYFNCIISSSFITENFLQDFFFIGLVILRYSFYKEAAFKIILPSFHRPTLLQK